MTGKHYLSGMEASLGKEMMEKIQSSKVLLVGAGESKSIGGNREIVHGLVVSCYL
jgi:tRNA A37 threonylcarbamoyladenosine dehydratase